MIRSETTRRKTLRTNRFGVRRWSRKEGAPSANEANLASGGGPLRVALSMRRCTMGSCGSRFMVVRSLREQRCVLHGSLKLRTTMNNSCQAVTGNNLPDRSGKSRPCL